MMVEIITAVIVALLFSAAAGIVKLIKKASLDSEFKDIERVLRNFGSTDTIEFEIAKDEGTVLTPFSPKQLSEFIRLKHNDNCWKGKEFDLMHKVKNTIDSTEVLPELKEITFCGVSIKCPSNWMIETMYSKNLDRFENSNNYPTIKCNNGNETSFSVVVQETSSSSDAIVISYINEIKLFGKSFIHSELIHLKNNKSTMCTSCSYAYKQKKQNRYGMILVYQKDSSHIVKFTASCKDDWSLMCSNLITTIIDSIEYDNAGQ